VTRRIVISVLALILGVLGAVALPLGLLTTAQIHKDYSAEAVTTASTVANQAEEVLGDGDSARPLHRLVGQLGQAGDQVSAYDAAGHEISATPRPPKVGSALLASARTATRPAVYQIAGAVLVLAPVRNDSDTANLGVVALARPTAAEQHRVALLWSLIALVATAGLAVAALVAFGLARWVSRPLDSLDRAAQRLGAGDLSTRSAADSGPGEVRSLAATFNLMAARLEGLLHGHRAMMADVSHQLRTPLSALRLRLELLAQDSDEEMAAELAGAQEEIGRLSRLVNGLLAVARAENTTAAPVSIAADAVIRSRMTAWQPAAEDQGIELTADVIEPVRVRMADGQLEQVLDNLLANALDALGPGGSVALTATAAGADRVRIAVVDDGPGMSQEQKRVAFRRFGTGTRGGTGLGLAIVDRLLASAGGTAALSDTAGGGLTVTIELPAAPARIRDPGRIYRF